MRKLFLAAFASFLFAHVGLSDTYVWEDYDDFSGSSLDSSKWEAGYFSGGQVAAVSSGVATLSGSGYTGSDVENVTSIWQYAASQSTGQSNSGLFVTSTEIYGIEVEVSIPQSGNSQNVGFIVETHSADGSTYNGIELAWRENGLNWSYENENPSTAQILELSQEADFDTSYTLSVIHTGSRLELHINGTRVANLNSNFTPNHWLIGSFNDEGKTFTVPIDNVRVLRRSTSETLDGSTLFLDSDDPVTLTLAFENGTVTSTFEDGGEDSGTGTVDQYDYIIVDQNRFSFTDTTKLDGTYITFDQSTGRGKLFDFKSDGQIDESGTWEFSFERFDLAVRSRSIWASRDLVYLQTPSGPTEIEGAGEIDFWAELPEHPSVTQLNLSLNGDPYDLMQKEAPAGFRTRFEYDSESVELFDLESASDSDWSPYINETTFTFSMTVDGTQYSYAHNLPAESELPQPVNVSVNGNYTWKKDTEGYDYVEILKNDSYQFSWDAFTTTDSKDYIVVHLQELVGDDDVQVMPEVVLDAGETSYTVDGSNFEVGKKYSFYVELMNVTEQQNPGGFTHASGSDTSLPLLQTTARMVSVLDIVMIEDYAPSSLVGKTIHIPEEGYDSNYYFTEDEAYYMVPLSSGRVDGISYTYVANTSTTATLTLARNEPGDVIHQISFSSPTNADSNWTDVENNVTDSISLEILTENYLPSSLAGWTYQGTSMNDTYHFIDDSNAVFYDESDSNFSNRELSNITYTWEQVGPRIGKLTTSLDEETLLFFDSNTSGFFDWEETGSDGGNSGQFDLYYYSVGKAFESLVGSSITIGDTTYVFTSPSTVTVHSPSGTSSQEYAYLRENEDEALLSVGSSLYKLDFYNHQYGRIIEGGSGYFSIHQNWATKGWVWQDHYPWAYSNNMQDWFYQVLFINDENESDMAHYQVWDNQWSIPSELHYFGESDFSSADAYSWEVYDDFNGTELNSSKWGTMYLGGGIEPYVSGGKLVLSAGSGNSSSVKVVKAGWEDIFQNDDGGQAWVYPMDNEIMGIEAEFVIPSSVNSMSGLALGVASLSPLTYATAELNADPNSASQYSQGFGFYHLENNGSEVENFATTQRDTTHRLGATFIEGKIKLYVDGEIRYEGVAGTFNTDMFFLNGFNDYQGQGLAFELTVDNVRVLRKKSYPQGWMWMDYYPWAYSYESNSWLYFQLAKDTDGQPGMIYWDTATKDWDIYHPSLSPEQVEDQKSATKLLNQE